MSSFENIPDTLIRSYAQLHSVKTRGREIKDILKDCVEKGQGDQLLHLEKQFQFAGSPTGLTLCKPDSNFPDKSKSAEDFIKVLINEKHVSKENIGHEWQPELRQGLQICSVVQEGSDVFIKFVEGKRTTQKYNYGKRPALYAHFTSIVIHFGEQVIEVRCAHTYRKTYVEIAMKLLGFAEPYKWHSWTTVTKEEAKLISAILSADLVSTEINLPSTVGSIRFTADRSQKGVNLRNDETYRKIVAAIKDLDIPTDDTNDESCEFVYTDPTTSIKMPVSFEINIRQGGFKFLKPVTEGIITTVIEAFIHVCFTMKQTTINEAATGEAPVVNNE